MTAQSSFGRNIAEHLGRSRRDFLRGAAGVALGSTLLSASPFVRGAAAAKKRKVIVITFGGGARDQETFAPEGQENIPHLIHELAPQASFFTQVMNQGILGHYVATASLATGVYETLNNFSAVPPDHPTVFEYFRKDLNWPPSDAWVVAPSNGFNRIGESDYRSFGPGLGAGWFCPSICWLLPCLAASPITPICCVITTRLRCTRPNLRAANSSCNNWK